MFKVDPCAGVQLKVGDHGRYRAVAVNPGLRFELSWERYSQLAACAQALKDASSTNAELTVLDVGGTDGALALFLPDCTVDVVDCDIAGSGDPLASVSAISAGSPGSTAASRRSAPSQPAYDAVISTDVLEHIEPRRRGIFIAQLALISRHFCVLNYALPDSATAQKVVGALTGRQPHFKSREAWFTPILRQYKGSSKTSALSCSTRQHTSRALWATFMALKT